MDVIILGNIENILAGIVFFLGVIVGTLGCKSFFDRMGS